MSTFYLGAHQPHWLAQTDVPLFISRRRLAGRKTFPRARGTWALDSGGFSEIAMFGRYETPPEVYVEEVRRFQREIGGLAWAAPQDWMCEPPMVEKTGLSVREHQDRTIASYLRLRDLAPDLPWIPVLQGWSGFQYFGHVEAYQRAGVDLSALPLVGVGSVCRRQGTAFAAELFRSLRVYYSLKIHGFGVKTTGLRSAGDSLISADSMAWSSAGRREAPLAGHPHKNCANCLEFALLWRENLPEAWISAPSGGRSPELRSLSVSMPWRCGAGGEAECSASVHAGGSRMARTSLPSPAVESTAGNLSNSGGAL